MTNAFWILAQILPILGFVLALVLLVHLVREQGPPPTTIAWVLAICLVPYVGVPLYIMLGGRKARRMSKRKGDLLITATQTSSAQAEGAEDESCYPGASFPLRDGNQATLLPTGVDAFRCLIESIDRAQQSIYVTTYTLGRDETGKAILRALARKSAEGIEVCLLADALGSRKTQGDFFSEFEAAGGKSAFFMPMIHLPFRGRANLRNHRKIVLIDRAIGIVGGMNLAQEYLGAESTPQQWHDLSLMVKGPVVSDLYRVFESDWEFAAGGTLMPREGKPVPVEGDDPLSLQVVPSGPDVAGDLLYDKVLSLLFTAQKRIWIVTPYFVPDEMLVKALCLAARRKVDVRIVLPKVSNHRLADLVRLGYLRQIQAAGAKVMLFAPGMLHAKLIIVDDSPGIIGSINMDMRSFFLNYEIALFVYTERMVRELDAWARETMAQCETGVREAGVVLEFAEGMVRLLAPLL